MHFIKIPMTIFKRKLGIMIAVLLLCGLQIQQVKAAEPEYTTYDDLNGKIVAMLTGAPFEELIKSHAPKVKEFQYFSSIPDMKIALTKGKIDAYLMNNAVAELAVNKDESLALFPEVLGETTFGFAFKKGSAKRKVWQEAFSHISESTITTLWEKWTGADESQKTLMPQSWDGSNGTIHVAACDTLEPMSYRGDDGEIKGFDIELILMMAKELDVHVVFDGMEFASIMPSVESGKALIGTGSIVVNDERKEVVDFIDYYPAKFVLIVRAANTQKASGSLWTSIKNSFHRTFIKDQRYKMVVSGLVLTLVMAVAAGILGTCLAFALVFLRQRNIKLINHIISLYGSLIAGVPVVVILMVLYYIVFGAVHIPAVFVAVIGFTLIFGSRAFNVIWNAVQTIDKGQEEAALALGYTPRDAFKTVILPQSRQFYLPLLQTQFVTLVKETSVAGYITVLELTRAGDLIRSRTMEAFFPLLSIALIYFVLTWLFGKAVGLIRVYDYKQHNHRRIKGVDDL